MCEYKTSQKEDLRKHVETTHVKHDIIEPEKIDVDNNDIIELEKIDEADLDNDVVKEKSSNDEADLDNDVVKEKNSNDEAELENEVLILHKVTHSKEIMFQCEACPKLFVAPG